MRTIEKEFSGILNTVTSVRRMHRDIPVDQAESLCQRLVWQQWLA